MADILTLVQIICLVLLLIGAPVYEFLKLKQRAERAERMANTERLHRRTAEHELEQLRIALRDLQRRSIGTAQIDASCGDTYNQSSTDSLKGTVEASPREALPIIRPKTPLISDQNHDRNSGSSI